MGLIGNANSDLLNLLSGAAPSARSSAFAADTSQFPATGSFQELLLLFPSTDVGGVGQLPSETPAPDSMLPMTQPDSESLLLVTPTDLSSLRSFSQNGSLFPVNRGQQAPVVSLLSELERLEQAVAELPTVTLYVPPETGLNPATAPTETTTSLQLLDPDSEKHSANIISDEAQQTIGSSADELPVFPQLAAADQRLAAELRRNLNAIPGMHSEPAGMRQISAASGAVADQLVSIKDAASPLALTDSDARAVSTSAIDSIPSSSAGSVIANTVAVSGVVANDLQLFPQHASADQSRAADLRLNVNAVPAMDFESAGIAQISATQAAYSKRLVSIQDAASPLALTDSDTRPETTLATNSIPSSPSGSVIANTTAAPAVAANDLTEPFVAESLLRSLRRESTPVVRSAAGAAVAPIIPAIRGKAAPSTSIVNSGAAEVVEAAMGSLSTSSSADLPVPVSSLRGGAGQDAVGPSASSAVVTVHRETQIGETGQPITPTAAAGASAAAVTPLADHRSQSIPTAAAAATTAETSEPDSGHASSEGIAERQGQTEKSDGRSFSQGDGSEQRQPRGVVPPVLAAAVKAVAPGVFSQAASAAVAAEQQEPELTTTPAPVSDKTSATAISEGLASSITAVVPSVASPAAHRLLNPLDLAEQLAAEVSRRVETSVVDGQERFTMRLDPPELGELVISMRRTAGGIELHVEAADPATMNLIQNGIDQLKSDPARPGSIFQQLNIDVTTSGHGSGHSADQRRPATEAASMGRVAANASDNAVDRNESEQISFVA